MPMQSVVLTIATDTQKSAAFKMPNGVDGMAVLIPALDANGAVTIEAYDDVSGTALYPDSAVLAADQDTNWFVVSNAADGTDLTIVNSGVEGELQALTSGALDSVRGLRGLWVRFVVGAAQIANRTFKVNV